MKVSERKAQKIFDAIHENFIAYRVQLRVNKHTAVSVDRLDSDLFTLEQTLWRHVAKELKVQP